MLDTVLRIFYAHPAVEGILLWGFWGPIHGEGEEASLVSGREFRVRYSVISKRGYIRTFRVRQIRVRPSE